MEEEKIPQPQTEPQTEPQSQTEKKKGKFRLWWEKHKPTKRRLIQVYVALLTNANIKGFTTGRIYAGATKSICVPGLNCYSCPGAVGACPLGSLQNAFAQSGTRTPYYVIGILLLLGLLFARTICGFFCPMGLAQDLAYKIKTPKLKKSRVTRILSYLKYVLLAVTVIAVPLIYGAFQTPIPAFCKYICPAGTLGGALALLANPANAAMYESLGAIFTWKFCLLVVIAVASVFIYRVFCRFLCPLGAIYGFFNKFALLGIKLDKKKCTDCGLCVSHCKMDIKHVGDHECINCGECIDVCPAKAISWKGSKLFVHENAVQPAAAEERPLEAANISVKFAGSAEEAAEAQRAFEEAEAERLAREAEAAKKAAELKAEKHRKKVFWVRVGAWIVALAVLAGAIVYYNFIHKNAETGGNKVGDTCYDFTLPLYNGGGEFTLSEHRGKIVLINFWATWCGSCVTELPDFERIAEEHDDVEVVAIHSSNITEGNGTMDDVQTWLNNMANTDVDSGVWADWEIYFAQDSGDRFTSEVFAMLGGKDAYPVTLIVDGDGVITFIREGNVDYNTLDMQIRLIYASQAAEE